MVEHRGGLTHLSVFFFKRISEFYQWVSTKTTGLLKQLSLFYTDNLNRYEKNIASRFHPKLLWFSEIFCYLFLQIKYSKEISVSKVLRNAEILSFHSRHIDCTVSLNIAMHYSLERGCVGRLDPISVRKD